MRVSNILRGEAASTGVYRGYAHVCRSGDDVDDLPRGCVLVVVAAVIATSRAFDRIGALVAEQGGILGTCLTMAREEGIPAVVAVADATMLIHTGDEVIVDGAGGLVVVTTSLTGSARVD